MYRSQDLAQIDAFGYVKKLLAELQVSYVEAAGQMEVTIDGREVSLNVDTAVPLGLIVNELFSNCLKHAFPKGRRGTISVSLRTNREGELELIVANDGVGMPARVNIENPRSFGLDLELRMLVSQLHGRIEVKPGAGTTFRVTFRELEEITARSLRRNEARMVSYLRWSSLGGNSSKLRPSHTETLSGSG